MKRVLAHPLLWLALAAMWLLLARSLAPGQVLLAAIVASIGTWAASAVDAPRARLRRPDLIAKLVGLVVTDIVRSNIVVLRLALGRREPRSRFVAIPLELRDPNGLAVLACIITATPGSAWINYNARTDTVLVHVLDTEDGPAWGAGIKRTYEALLLEIFR
ncbi:MAG: Na+/H+ antiporter subunit E [Devosia sp.]|jgi:multicomponent K+:H+ antiporter subunit E|nr:Na+/H+ antiporter subunit E [Devosia sp.]